MHVASKYVFKLFKYVFFIFVQKYVAMKEKLPQDNCSYNMQKMTIQPVIYKKDLHIKFFGFNTFGSKPKWNHIWIADQKPRLNVCFSSWTDRIWVFTLYSNEKPVSQCIAVTVNGLFHQLKKYWFLKLNNKFRLNRKIRKDGGVWK